MDQHYLAQIISEKGMRVTPQRIAILSAIHHLNNHPSADKIIDFIKKHHPNIAVGTVYKVLDVLVANNILSKLKTEDGVMRYDPIQINHHHLYSSRTDRIEDFQDEELDALIQDYLSKKGIKNFEIEEFQLHITGTFKN